ncbi:MAG TPA: DUF167 domain-containing protein [Candidatus Nanoarchaeia archaeon]|nr:DUF167 domain-containing protein [Candidatus Nanoarchaeia archaeon]
MDLSKFIKNNLLGVRVIPHSGRTELKEENGKLKLYLKSVPEKGKANTELIKFFKKNHKLSVRITSGESSREKVIEVMKS